MDQLIITHSKFCSRTVVTWQRNHDDMNYYDHTKVFFYNVATLYTIESIELEAGVMDVYFVTLNGRSSYNSDLTHFRPLFY